MRNSLLAVTLLLATIAGFRFAAVGDRVFCWVEERRVRTTGGLFAWIFPSEGHTFIVCRDYETNADDIVEDNWAGKGQSKRDKLSGRAKSLATSGGLYGGVAYQVRRKYVKECADEGHRTMESRTGGSYPDAPSDGGSGKRENGYELDALSPQSGNNCRVFTNQVFRCIKAHAGLN